MGKLTLITCTGGRQQAFALCERWMRQQHYAGAVQWIVVDDCDPPTRTTMDQVVIRPYPRWEPGQVTLARNLLAAFEHANGDMVAFIEDDDYYPASYLASMVELLEYAPIVGEAPARYYNIQTRQYREMRNSHHASLCQTVMRREVLGRFADICLRNEGHLDITLWSEVRPLVELADSSVVGVKGMPGRVGIGIGHRPNAQWRDDPDGIVLRKWIGSDAKHYEGLTAEDREVAIAAV